MATVRKCVADLEGNGLLSSCTKLWCGVFIDVQTKEVHRFKPHQMQEMQDFMDTCSHLIFHNGYGYDFPVMEKVLGYKYKGKKIDTLVLSRLLFPDIHPMEGVRAGPHSVEAWGARFGRSKPDHEDWSQFSPEMLHRCSEDTHIQLQLYLHCIQKAKKDKWPKRAFDMTNKLFDILAKQEQCGWPVSVPRIEKNIRMLENWIRRIDEALAPKLPMVLELPYKDTPVRKPFKLDRTLAKIATNWYTDPEDQRTIGGPFTRINFRPVNMNSPDELKRFLLSEGWQPEEWNYKKDPETKRPLKDSSGKPVRSSPKLNGDDPFIGLDSGIGVLAAKRVQCASRKAILEGWLRSVRPDGRISQRITGIAATGRLTHSGIVNVPGNEAFFGPQMRRSFVASDGYVLVGTDSASCQDRMLLGRANKYKVNDPVFEDMLLNGDKKRGTDSHTRAKNSINKVLNEWNLPEITRSNAKNFNYA